MFAVIKTGGKQYRVQEGDILVIEKLGLEEGQKVTFDQVLLVDHEEKTLIGTPYLENAFVEGEVIENFKDKKVIIFKKKRRKQYKKKRGHRQDLTRIRIEEIVSELKAARKKEPAKPKPEAKPEEIKKAKPRKPEKVEVKDTETKAKKKAGAAKTAKPKGKALVKQKASAKASPKAKKSKKMKE